MQLLRQRGATASTLYLGIIPDAARMLGDLWDEDRCDFTQVTISMGRLQQIVRRLSPEFQIAAVSHAQPETIMLLPAPGDSHTLGLVILSEFFHREGWHVAGGPATTPEGGATIVRDTWVDVAGFSIGAASRIDALRKIIRTLRRVSRNRDLSVMVGGPLLQHQPDLVTQVGADMGARDAQTAVRQASGLLALRSAAD
jgi:methanogenic corrinoid protein MtbC1